ncbi:MAG: hypothetical protein U9Q77_13215, partial [Candidatus Marinimicrobia bacterium]|nr:hypothetical protein [Candidatus Neomarinimicrobiota bacterium]
NDCPPIFFKPIQNIFSNFFFSHYASLHKEPSGNKIASAKYEKTLTQVYHRCSVSVVITVQSLILW